MDAIATSLFVAIAKAFVWTLMGLNVILQYVGQKIFELGGFLIQQGLSLNASLLDNPIVQNGWLISRNIANLGIVFGMIFIAFVTILRIESWGAKKLLGSLIIVALLINFSLIIPGIFLDASGVISNFFSQKVSGADLSKFTEVLASATDVQKLISLDGSKIDISGTAKGLEGVTELSNSLISVIVQIFFSALFTIFAGIVFLNIAYMLFYRFIALAIILILAPLAATLYIFPQFRSYFSQWWNELLKWCFFLPVVMFFLYLTVLTTVGDNSFINTAINAASGPFAQNSFVHLFAQIGKMIVVLGLMTAGLVAGKRLGIAGAEWGLGLAGSVKNYVLGGVTGVAGGAVGAIAGAPAGLAIGASAAGGYLGRRFLRWGKDEQGNGGVGNALATTAARFGFVGTASSLRQAMTAQKGIVDEKIKERGNWTKEMAIASATRAASPLTAFADNEDREEEQAAAAVLLAQKGAFTEEKSGLKQARLDTLLAAARKLGVSKTIVDTTPRFGSEAEKMKFATTALTPKRALELDADDLADATIAAGLSKKAIEAVASDGSAKQRDGFVKGMEARLAKHAELSGLSSRSLDQQKWLDYLSQNLHEDIKNAYHSPALTSLINRSTALKDFITKERIQPLTASEESRPDINVAPSTPVNLNVANGGQTKTPSQPAPSASTTGPTKIAAALQRARQLRSQPSSSSGNTVLPPTTEEEIDEAILARAASGAGGATPGKPSTPSTPPPTPPPAA